MITTKLLNILDTNMAISVVVNDAAYAMKPTDRAVIITSAGDPRIITLPPAAKCVGRIYSLYVVTSADLHDFSIVGNSADDSPLIQGTDGLYYTPKIGAGGADEYVVLISDGRTWRVIAKGQ